MNQNFGRIAKKYAGQIVSVAILSLLVFSVLFPLYIMVVDSFKNFYTGNPSFYEFPREFVFSNYATAFRDINGNILNSVIVSFSCTVGTAALSAMTAYGFSRYRFPGSRILYAAILAIMMIPGILTLVPQYNLVKSLKINRDLLGVILPSVSGSISVNTMLFATFFAAIPRGLYEAMEIDGAGRVRQFFSLTLRMSAPILVTVALNTWMGTWNDYVWPAIILSSNRSAATLAVALTSKYSIDLQYGGYGPAFAAYVISALPLVVLFALTSKQFIGGLTSGAIKM